MNALQTKATRWSWRAAGVLAVAMVLAAPGCVKKPLVRLVDVQIDSIDLEKTDMSVGVNVTNPNWFVARMFALQYGMTVDGKELVSGEVPTPIEMIPAGAKRTYRIPLRISHDALMPFLQNLLGAEAIPYALTAEATFNVIGLPLPVQRQRTGKLPPIRALEPRLQAIRFPGDVPASLEVVFNVHNPNPFSMAMKRMDGAIYVGGEKVLTIYRSMTTDLPGGQTSELVVPIRLGMAAMVRAMAKAGSGKLEFRGNFILDVPGPFRNLLLDALPPEESE
jgi:LEA14-like dessication related protein